MRKLLAILLVLGLVLLSGLSARADDPTDKTNQEKALRKRAEDFIAAFNKADARALSGFWTPDGDYVDQAGQTLSGRDAIAGAFAKQFTAAKGAKLRITPASLRFLTPDCAIEDGTTELIYANGAPPTGARYTAIHLKRDGQWFLASVRDSILVPPSNHEHLRELEWLTGDWVDEAEKGEVAKASYSWAENDHFLVGSFVTTLKDVPVAGGTQWIGWDGAAKSIRSWSFDSNGGITEGVWSKDGEKWTVKVTATLDDGKKMSATNVITKMDGDHLTWQSTKRSMDGKTAPDSETVKMKRVNERARQQ